MDDQDRQKLLDRLFYGWGRDVAVAGAFLTRLPFRPGGDVVMSDLGPASRAFPLIGLLVGVFAGGALWLGAKADLHPLACGFIGLTVSAWITGALHEDGLADFVDGIGARTRERRLEIMRDSHIGTFGVLALVFSVGAKVALLAGFLGPGLAATALIAAVTISRAPIAVIMWRQAPARKDGLGRDAGQPTSADATIAMALAALCAVSLLGWAVGGLAVMMALCAAGMVAWLARKRLGGYTGDVLGAAQQAAEIAVLLAAGAYAI